MIVEAGVRFPSGVFISDTCDKDSSDRCRGDVFPFGGSGCRGLGGLGEAHDACLQRENVRRQPAAQRMGRHHGAEEGAQVEVFYRLSQDLAL